MGILNSNLHDFSGAATGKFWPGSAKEVLFHASTHVRELPNGVFRERWQFVLTRFTGDWKTEDAPLGRIPATPVKISIMDKMVYVKVDGVFQIWLLPGDVVCRNMLVQWAGGEEVCDVTLCTWPMARSLEVLIERP